VDLREVLEIRPGKKSKDFERWVDEGRRHDNDVCFVLLYGSEFCLKSLSLTASSVQECDLWIQGLTSLVADSQHSSYPLQTERWLRKEYYSLEKNSLVSLKDMKAWMTKINYKINNWVKEKYQTLGRVSVLLLSRIITFHDNLSKVRCSLRREVLKVEDFKLFLIQEQKESFASDTSEVKRHMLYFLDDRHREASGDVYFTKKEFMDYLFSSHNSIWNDQFSKVHQSMDEPLNHYWISSSHNTYLTGDQFKSESTCEAYARCLRQGCRCIELDCWDGPDGYPHIYHGRTLTTKIRFLDVLKTIRDHAWVASEYPLILSIEDHCSIPQQKNMAIAFKDVFGEMLLTDPIDPAASALPSPNQLKRKIILKHKKLPSGASDNEWKFSVPNDEANVMDSDLSNSVKNGILYLEDTLDKEWRPHFFVLCTTKLHYTEETSLVNADNDDDDADNSLLDNADLPNEELHFSEKWFHGQLRGGRETAIALLNQYSYLGDGAFLKRQLWSHQTMLNRLKTKLSTSNPWDRYRKECLTSVFFMRVFFRDEVLNFCFFPRIAIEPVPQPQSHENQDWYHDNMSRREAEDMLCRLDQDGAFLIRRRVVSLEHDPDPSQFAISFRVEGRIRRCRIRQEGRLFTIGNASFESLVDLVQYYEHNPLYRRMKLRYPVNDRLIRMRGQEPNAEAIYSGDIYACPNDFVSPLRVRALYGYSAQREDELSFVKHAVISNVQKQDGGWWRGDYGEKRQLWFPSNYVEPIEDETLDLQPLGSLQKGMFDLSGVTVGMRGESHPYIFRIIFPAPRVIEIAAATEEDMLDWISHIRRCANEAEKENRDRRRLQRSKIAHEISDLIVYCRSVLFDEDRSPSERNYYEMSSLPETKVEKFTCRTKCRVLLDMNNLQFSRIYPKGQRIDSSNYDPMPVWNCGCHMAAINYQTPDRAMQTNGGRFMLNGGCGYVLQPKCM
ncbi:hypothetical protein CAPTEDRAFT_22409, partial [Capitella teleta]